MNVGIELRQVTFGASGGIAQYLQGTLQAAFRLFPSDKFLVFCTVFSRQVLEDIPSNVTVETVPGYQFFARVDEAAARQEIDVLFRSYPLEVPLQMSWAKQVVLIPDLQHDVYPEFCTPEVLRLRRLAFNDSLSNAGALLTFTHYVRGTIRAHPWAVSPNVFLSAPALTLDCAQDVPLSAEEQSLIPADPFFFYPANLWPHKNHRRVLQAFEKLLKRREGPLQLILTGHPEGWNKLRDEFPGLPVTHLGYVRGAMVRSLLTQALALPFFSLHEGFGIPLLEAFAADTPVICSNTTSLPEVGGDAVLSCDPTDVSAISSLMNQIADDDSTRRRLIERGKARLAYYTWESAAQGLMDACRHAAQARPSPVIRVTDPPLASIVTPSFNQGRYLRSTIESVLNQTYPHIQYIVMDGGSTDQSVDILKSYGDRFFWKSQKDNGQTHAVNLGMAMAKGQVLAYLNSDDVLMPGAVERAVTHFHENPSCDMMYGRANYIDSEGTIIGAYKTDEYSFSRLMRDCCICQPAAFWLSRIAQRVGPFDESLHCALDFDYWLRIDRAGGRIQHIHDVLASSRTYPDTKTMSMRNQCYSEIFDLCLRRAGYVEYNYFLGQWHYRVCERPSGWLRHLRFIPGIYYPLSKAHYTLFELRRRGFRQWTRQTLQQTVNRTARAPVVGPILHKLWHLWQLAVRPRVEGFFHDNWMQPHSSIVVQPRGSGQKVRHVGMSPCDMKVTVEINQKVVGAYALRAGKTQAIGEDIPLDGNGPVRLRFRFSDHIVDTSRRKLSFLVTETNLFGESDLA